MITPRDIERKTMTEAKRKEAHKSWFAFYIGRPISYCLTIPLLYTDISPNTITFISILFAISGFCGLSFGISLTARLAGVAFFFLWNMADGIDGNIARYKELKSENGDLLDTLGGYISMTLILLGMGIAACYDPSEHIYFSPRLPVILGGISSIETLIPRVLMHRKIAISKKSDSAEKLKDKETYGLAKIIILNICDPAGFQEVFMLICVLAGLCTEFTIAFFIINTAVMIYSIWKLME